MVNRRSEKLDRLLNKRVVVTFYHDVEHEGILEFNRSFTGLPVGSNMYSLDGIIFFRKTHVKSIREVEA